MTQSTDSRQRPTGGKKRPKRFSRPVAIAIATVATLVFGAGIYLGIQFAKPPPPPDLGGFRRQPPPPPPPSPLESSEQEAEGDGDELEVIRQSPQPRSSKPRIALIIDDLGRSLKDLDTLAALGIPLTYSVLPFESRTPEVARELQSRGAEVICHLPMEAKGGNNPGPGAILLGMSKAEVRQATRQAVEAVEGAVGVNNHMGSGISADRQAITAVLGVLAKESLFYVDSRTSLDSLGFSVARQLGLPRAERQVFLDNDLDPEKIREQFARLLKVATERGDAIAIGHPHAVTLEVLADTVGPAQELGYEFVVASQLLTFD